MSDLPDELPVASSVVEPAGGPPENGVGAAAPPASVAGAADASDRPSLAVVARRFAIVGVLFAADLWSKAAAFEWLTSGVPLERDACTTPHRRIPLIGEWFAFMRSENKGAAFGQLDSVPYLLVGGRVLAVLFLAWLLVRTSTRRRVLTAAFVLILAGAMGNLYDNLALDPPVYDPDHPFGYVRDFIDVYFVGWTWHFPTFNVADSCITVGAVLLLLTGFKSDPAEPEPARA